MTELPDLALPLKKMKFLLDLESEADRKTLLGFAVVKAIRDKKPLKEIISMLKESAADNPEDVLNVIGQNCYDQLLKF